jgi:branched-chain amino acid transport system ATP-binding protein
MANNTMTKKYQHALKKVDGASLLLTSLETIKEERLHRLKKKQAFKLEKLKVKHFLNTCPDDDYINYYIKPYQQKIGRKIHFKSKRLLYLNKASKETIIQTLNQQMTDLMDHKSRQVLSKRKKRTLIHLKQFEAFTHKSYIKYDTKLNHFIQLLKVKTEKTLKKYHAILDQYEPPYVLPNDTILHLDHISMHFGGIKAVDDVSIEVKKGDIFGLIGPNGAGKTTVFNCITRFYQPTLGEMYFKNKFNHTIKLNDIEVHQVIEHGIARTFQNVELVYELSILDNLLVGAHSLVHSSFTDHLLHTNKLKRETEWLKKRALKILNDLGLFYYQAIPPIGLPYGILKKIELARVLMTHPTLIILDEPAAGLNDMETKDLAATIKKIKQEYDVTIILVEHDMGLVMEVCNRICAISFGKEITTGSPLDIQSHPQVKEAYLGGDLDA